MHTCRRRLPASESSSGLLHGKFRMRTSLVARTPVPILRKQEQGCLVGVVCCPLGAVVDDMGRDVGVLIKLSSLRVSGC